MGQPDQNQGEPVKVLGRDFTCQVCGHDRFWHREAQLNTAVATFFNMDWANPSATCLICTHCGYIHWFMPK